MTFPTPKPPERLYCLRCSKRVTETTEFKGMDVAICDPCYREVELGR